MSDFEQFLAEQAKGEFHSSGTFSISTRAARQKLAEFQLASPGLYLLKVIQTALSVGAPEVQVIISTRKVEVRFQGDPEKLPPNQLISGLSNPQTMTKESLRHLAVGMVAGLVFPSAQVIFSTLTPTGGWTLELTQEGDQARVDLRIGALPGMQLVEPGAFRLELKRSDSRALERRADEHSTIYQRCAFAPVPILVDGRPIEKGWVEKPEPRIKASGAPAPAWLAIRYIGGTGLEVGYGPPWPQRNSINEGTTCYQFQDLKTESLVGVTCAIPTRDGNKASLRLVKHGVCLDPVELDLPFPFRCVIPSDTVPVDLSEFLPRLSAELTEARKTALKVAEKTRYSLHLNAGFLPHGRDYIQSVIG